MARPSRSSDSADSTTRSSWSELCTLGPYLRPYRTRIAVAIVCLICSSLLAVGFPTMIRKLADAAIVVGQGKPVTGWDTDINAIALSTVGLLTGLAVFSFFNSYLFHQIGQRCVADLRRDTYRHILNLPMTFFGERRVGELTSRMSSDLGQIEELLTFTFQQFLRQATILTGSVVLILMTSWKLSLVMVCSFPVMVLLAVLFGKQIRKLSRAAQDRLAESATVVEETFQAIASVKAFHNEPYEDARYGQQLDGYLGIILRTVKFRAGLVGFIMFGIFGAIVLVFWYGAKLIQTGELSAGQLLGFVLYTVFLGGSVASFAEVYSVLQKTLGSTQRVRELLQEKPEAGLDISEGPKLEGRIEFSDVRFTYPSRLDAEVLKGLTLTAAPGQKIALVGPSGAGKSTITALLLRFYEPSAGILKIDGRDAREFPLGAYRNNFALVPQEILLFGGSIRDNIAYGRPGASEAEIIEAARQANCEEFITRLPEGFNTLVGERGVKLSGGQRQRVAIARAFLRNPKILILDEATSSLDSESERLVQESLAVLMQGRTTVVIAHRLATVRQVDCLYVVNDGRVVESGTHGDLMQKTDGLYRRLAETQFVAA